MEHETKVIIFVVSLLTVGISIGSYIGWLMTPTLKGIFREQVNRWIKENMAP